MRLVLYASLLSLLVGCDALFPFVQGDVDAAVDTRVADRGADSTADAPPSDAPPSDAPPSDAPPSDGTVDAPPSDGTVDVPVVDSAVDGPAADGSVDGPAADSTVDAPAADSTVDAPAADASVDSGVDGPSAGPCGAGAQAVSVTGWSQMILCEGAVADFQCSAASLCGSWSLCTASDYLARGGAQYGTATGGWLQACIREGGASKTSNPTDAICSGDCVYQTATSVFAAWDCSGAGTLLAVAGGANVGLVSAASCTRVGRDQSANAGFWQIRSTYQSIGAAVCCQP